MYSLNDKTFPPLNSSSQGGPIMNNEHLEQEEKDKEETKPEETQAQVNKDEEDEEALREQVQAGNKETLDALDEAAYAERVTIYHHDSY